jgi:hypothetical protein
VANRLLVVVVGILALGLSALGQSKPSIQGVWRVVEVTITNPNANPAGLGKGTHTVVQPGLLIVSGKHYSLVTDTAGKPRPTAPIKVPQKPTHEEMQSQWAPFQANAGTYEVSGTTLTTRAIVAKNPSFQAKGVNRYTIKLDGQNLWTTLVETSASATKIEYPTTVKWMRVE